METRSATDTQRADLFNEKFNRNGDIDRRDGDVSVNIDGDLVTNRRGALSDIAQHAAKVVLQEFGGLGLGQHQFVSAVLFGRPSGSSGLGGDGLHELADVRERITRANSAIQQNILQHTGRFSATVSVEWDNK